MVRNGDSVNRSRSSFFRMQGDDFGDEDLPSTSSDHKSAGVTHVAIRTAGKSLTFRDGLIDELAKLVDLEGFDEGKEALGRLRAAMDELERSRTEMYGTEMAAGTGPGEVYSMMAAIERRTAKVERGLDGLSKDALEIVSSALVEVDIIEKEKTSGGTDDAPCDHK